MKTVRSSGHFNLDAVVGLSLIAQDKIDYYEELHAPANELLEHVLSLYITADNSINPREKAHMALSLLARDARNFEVAPLFKALDAVRVTQEDGTINRDAPIIVRGAVNKQLANLKETAVFYNYRPLEPDDYEKLVPLQENLKPGELLAPEAFKGLAPHVKQQPPRFDFDAVTGLVLAARDMPLPAYLFAPMNALMQYVLPSEAFFESDTASVQDMAKIVLKTLMDDERNFEVKSIARAIEAVKLKKIPVARSQNPDALLEYDYDEKSYRRLGDAINAAIYNHRASHVIAEPIDREEYEKFLEPYQKQTAQREADQKAMQQMIAEWRGQYTEDAQETSGDASEKIGLFKKLAHDTWSRVLLTNALSGMAKSHGITRYNKPKFSKDNPDGLFMDMPREEGEKMKDILKMLGIDYNAQTYDKKLSNGQPALKPRWTKIEIDIAPYMGNGKLLNNIIQICRTSAYKGPTQ